MLRLRNRNIPIASCAVKMKKVVFVLFLLLCLLVLQSSLTVNNAKVKREEGFVAAVLVICATRAKAIENHLEQLTRLRPSSASFPILVSQDGEDSTVREVIKKYANQSQYIVHVQHKRPALVKKATKSERNYYYITQHYKWALDQAFRTFKYSHVIITEGWMLRAELWEELRGNWPERYWDDWMRKPEIRKGRSCIRPEVSRTAHNMKVAGKGTSGGMYKAYLSSIRLPEKAVDFALVDVASMQKERFDKRLGENVREAKVMEFGKLNTEVSGENSYRITYSNAREWRKIAEHFKLMTDIRSGMVRTAYYGVVPFSVKGTRYYAVPSWLDLSKFGTDEQMSAAYDPKWDLQSKFMDFEAMYCKPSRFNGRCDPSNPELIEWFRKRNILKKLESWGEMILV